VWHVLPARLHLVAGGGTNGRVDGKGGEEMSPELTYMLSVAWVVGVVFLTPMMWFEHKTERAYDKRQEMKKCHHSKER